MAKIIFVDGTEAEVGVEDYKRFINFVARNTSSFKVMKDGTFVNMDNVLMIEPGGEEAVKEPEPNIETEDSSDDKPEEETKETIPPFHIGQLKALMENLKMNEEAFGKTIGYSGSTVRMAMREGRMSDAFVKAGVEKYSKELKIKDQSEWTEE